LSPSILVHLRPNAATAYAYLEARVWPNGPVCPKCGGIDRTGKMKGKSTRIGVLPVPHVAPGGALMASSKKGISSNQLHRTLGVTIKTA
jgi:hypothetical protein